MSLFAPVSIQTRVDFTKSLSVMLKSGISIDEALASLEEQSASKRFGLIIRGVRTDIENGTMLSVAFGKQAHVFGPVFVSLIKAGEESGTLQNNLQFLADWLGRNADLRREVDSAMLYPKLVFSAALLLGGALAVFILPRLVPLFGQLNVELPFITVALLAAAVFVQKYWLLTIGVVIALVILVMYSNKVWFIRRFYHECYLRMPFIGTMLRNYQLALLAQLFGTLLRSGLSLNDSMGIVREAATNVVYESSVRAIDQSLLKGTTLSESMLRFESLYPKLVVNIIKVGERSGTLVNSFEYLAEYYTKEVNATAKKLPTIIEPLLLIFIAAIVGFVALAIILPIYKLTGSITR